MRGVFHVATRHERDGDAQALIRTGPAGTAVATPDRAYELGVRSLDESDEGRDHRLPVEGSVPNWLSGALIRNGPGSFEFGGRRARHWFDGLAMLRRYGFAAGEIRYTNRSLRTEAYAERGHGGASSPPLRGRSRRHSSGFGRSDHRTRLTTRTSTSLDSATTTGADGVATTDRLRPDDPGNTQRVSLSRRPHRTHGDGPRHGRSPPSRDDRVRDRIRPAIAVPPLSGPVRQPCAQSRRVYRRRGARLRTRLYRHGKLPAPGRTAPADLDPPGAGAVGRRSPRRTRVRLRPADEDLVVDLVAFDDADIVDALSFEALADDAFAAAPDGRLVR